MLKTYGQNLRVALMQGSLEDWIEQGGPVENDPIVVDIWAKDISSNLSTTMQKASTRYQVSPNARRILDMEQFLQIVLDERMERTL